MYGDGVKRTFHPRNHRIDKRYVEGLVQKHLMQILQREKNGNSSSHGDHNRVKRVSPLRAPDLSPKRQSKPLRRLQARGPHPSRPNIPPLDLSQENLDLQIIYTAQKRRSQYFEYAKVIPLMLLIVLFFATILDYSDGWQLTYILWPILKPIFFRELDG